MQERQYKEMILKCGSMNLVIQMPNQSVYEEQIRKEIKNILKSALQEQLQTTS